MRKIGYYLLSISRLVLGIRNWPLVVLTFLGLHRRSPKSIFLRSPRLEFRVRGPMDIWSVKEAFLDRFYEKYGAPVENGWTVVDIGAGIGEYTLFAALQNGGGRVVAFEPFTESYQLLVENLRRNSVSHVETYSEAVWSCNGCLAMDLSGGEPLQLQSMQGEPPTGVQSTAQRVVPCVGLSERLESLGIQRVDMLKLDCEGAEYEILFNTPLRTLASIQRIVMEYHDGVTRYQHSDLSRFLEKQGYRVRTVQNIVHADLGYLYAERL